MYLLSLYCKSYSTDLRRVVRLAQSVERFNSELIPFYVSVPQADVQLFKEHLSAFQVEILDDESIIACTAYANSPVLKKLPGHLLQQVVKSEYWRLGVSTAYVCLDSDAVFIRPFRHADFLLDKDCPYTVMDEAHEHLEACLLAGKKSIMTSYFKEAHSVQTALERQGRAYAFGPFPLVWHRDVWQSLDAQYLQPRSMTFMDAIQRAPLESRWYGEALLKYQAIPLIPCQPLFKVYHYAWQLDRDVRKGISVDQLGHIYCGVIYQSSWERELDWPQEGGNWLSRIGRRIRRGLGRM